MRNDAGGTFSCTEGVKCMYVCLCNRRGLQYSWGKAGRGRPEASFLELKIT